MSAGKTFFVTKMILRTLVISLGIVQLALAEAEPEADPQFYPLPSAGIANRFVYIFIYSTHRGGSSLQESKIFHTFLMIGCQMNLRVPTLRLYQDLNVLEEPASVGALESAIPIAPGMAFAVMMGVSIFVEPQPLPQLLSPFLPQFPHPELFLFMPLTPQLSM